jgi:hypothetical protein
MIDGRFGSIIATPLWGLLLLRKYGFADGAQRRGYTNWRIQ